jgi:hypothetical protein
MSISAGEYRVVWSASGAQRGERTGGWRSCQLAGCRGVQVAIRWPGGKITYPCTRGLVLRPDGDWQIG